VVQDYRHNYLGGRDKEDRGLRPAPENEGEGSSHEHLSSQLCREATNRRLMGQDDPWSQK
jgi:hypothetical protein